MNRLLTLLLALAVTTSVFAEDAKPRIRVSAWYWLNSAPKSDWQGDLVTMKNLGFTDVLLCWGLDLAGVTTRKTETKQAMEYARQAGLGAYLLIWQPNANSLPRDPKYMQVSAAGKVMTAFDTYNPEWRATQWKAYLQDIAETYADNPAMAGYVFDDSFGGAGSSYGPYEEKTFGAPLPKKAGDPRWEEFIKARQGWWEDWGRDTVDFIRAKDSNKSHEIYIEDNFNHVGKAKGTNDPVDFARVAKHFDAVGGYTAFGWSTNQTIEQTVEVTKKSIAAVREMAGSDANIVYTFWCADHASERDLGVAAHPTAAELKAICEAALAAGVKHLDMYGYRIGEFKATAAEMRRMMPAEPAPYILTGQFPGKFMWDRPEIHDELATYLHSLQTK
jgi:hypothetical protein